MPNLVVFASAGTFAFIHNNVESLHIMISERGRLTLSQSHPNTTQWTESQPSAGGEGHSFIYINSQKNTV